MKKLLTIIACFISTSISAQEHIDTLYYNKSGQIAHTPILADYYRVAFYPAKSSQPKEFKDFYYSGELRKEGYFHIIDSLDDNKTTFEGEILSYFKNGKISEKFHYTEDQLHGEYLQYNEDGTLQIQAFYEKGELSGIYKKYYKDGSCQITEYDAGQPVYDYYLLSDNNGNTLKFRIADNMPIWESPAIAERFVEYRDGTPWEVYFKNGITLALTNTILREYGKWHRIDLIVSNHSLTPIEFTPEFCSAYSINAQGLVSYQKVWTCDEYMKKVTQAQTWAAIAMGICEGIATAGAGYSTSTTTGYNSLGGFSTYTTTTYNASSAYLAHAASQQRIANFGQALQDEKNIKQIGYLKKNTIYPGESISGYILVERIKGERIIFTINIESAEYLYEWGFNKKMAYLID